MTIHRNWALPTASLIIISALWSWWQHNKSKAYGAGFILSLIFILILLSITAWHGAELVYRYGVGVIPISKEMTGGRHHTHSSSHGVHIDHE